jgi:hypothetical protein
MGILTTEMNVAQRVKPHADEFELREDEVEHKPTGATWFAYPGRPEPHNLRLGMLGSVLSNGDDYRDYEVAEIALRLLASRMSTE